MDARKLLGDGKLQVKVVLVVLETDVEARTVVLDEVVLEDQRLDLVGGGDELEVGRPPDELRYARRLRVSGREVRAQAITQPQGLADVDDLRLAVAEHVDARAVRNGLQPSFDRFLE